MLKPDIYPDNKISDSANCSMNLLPEFHVKTKLPSSDPLEKTASDLVCVHPPMIVSQTDSDLPEMIKEATHYVWYGSVPKATKYGE